MGYKSLDGSIIDSCLEKLQPGESFVVFRAQDSTGDHYADQWATDHEKRLGEDHPKIKEMRHRAQLMRKWPNRKLPD